MFPNLPMTSLNSNVVKDLRENKNSSGHTCKTSPNDALRIKHCQAMRKEKVRFFYERGGDCFHIPTYSGSCGKTPKSVRSELSDFPEVPF